MTIICSYFVLFCFSISFLIFDYIFRVQGGESQKYCRIPIDDVYDVENIFELLHNAVNFICTNSFN